MSKIHKLKTLFEENCVSENNAGYRIRCIIIVANKKKAEIEYEREEEDI